MKKILLSFFIFILCCISPISSFASDKNLVKSEVINVKKNNFVVFGEYPVVKGLSNKNFEAKVNNEINKIIKENFVSYQKIANFKIQLSYETIVDKDIVSILLYFKNTFSDEIYPFSVNFDSKKNIFIDINKFLGVNGLSYSNKVVNSKANDLGYNFIEVTNKTPFYIKNNNVYIVYGAGSITFVQNGNIIFEILSKNIKNYRLPSTLYYKKSEYNVKMVPFREILEYFGFEMKWNAVSNSATVYYNNKFVSYIVVGKNIYTGKNNKVVRQLEFPPEMRNGKTYVPISYFSNILEMLFAIDGNNDIIISSYKI